MSKVKKLQEDIFLEKYLPIQNHIDDNASYDGCMFETYGEEVDYVVAKANNDETRNHVWTIVTGDGNAMYYTAGFRYVNRMGYIITKNPWETGNEEFAMDVNMGEEVYYLSESDFTEDGWQDLIEKQQGETECEDLEVLHENIIISNKDDLNVFLLEYANVTQSFINAVTEAIENGIIFQFKGDGDGLGFILDIWESQADFEEGEVNQSFTLWFDDYRE